MGLCEYVGARDRCAWSFSVNGSLITINKCIFYCTFVLLYFYLWSHDITLIRENIFQRQQNSIHAWLMWLFHLSVVNKFHILPSDYTIAARTRRRCEGSEGFTACVVEVVKRDVSATESVEIWVERKKVWKRLSNKDVFLFFFFNFRENASVSFLPLPLLIESASPCLWILLCTRTSHSCYRKTGSDLDDLYKWVKRQPLVWSLQEKPYTIRVHCCS